MLALSSFHLLIILLLTMTQQYPPSYYQATLNLQIESNPLTENIEAETCVIGAGYAGLMTALGLIEKGHSSVVILEENRVGWGASGRNGGFVFAGYSLGARQLVKQVGEAQARELYQLTVDGVDLIRKRIRKYKIDCDKVDEGVIWANWFNDQKALFKERDFMRQTMQVEWDYLPPEKLAEQIKTKRYHGGLFEANALHFHPLNYAQGIASQILKAGGQIFEQSPVTAIDYQGAIKTVTTTSGQVSCKNIVLAAGGYIGDLCKPVARSILPIATYVMATEPLGDKLTDYINTKAAIYDTRFAFDYYRPLNDRRILWGGRVSANTKTPKNLRQQLQSDLGKVFPDLADAKIDYVWDGWMAYARHQMAQIGELAPGVWYGIGFGGHGVGPTTMAGEVLSSAIANNDQTYKKFTPWGLPWNGSIFGAPAAQASYWWYQFKDWLRDF